MRSCLCSWLPDVSFLLAWVLQEDQVRKVGLSRYSRVSRTAFGLNGKKRIAVLRAGGAILSESLCQSCFQHCTRLCCYPQVPLYTVSACCLNNDKSQLQR